MRRPIVAGNWKMNTDLGGAVALARGVVEAVGGDDATETVLCPPFVALDVVRRAIDGSSVVLGAQNVHFEPDGACTGEISTSMLGDLACRYCIVGHSERRTLFGETDDVVSRKAAALLDAGIRPIVCVGESLAEREADRTEHVVGRQVRGSLRGIETRLADVVIAYEPIWAIGTGRTATADQAQAVHAVIRALIAELAGGKTAAGLRIQYGGSVKPGNAAELFGQPDIDGGLIGGASLTADSFAAIVRAA